MPQGKFLVDFLFYNNEVERYRFHFLIMSFAVGVALRTVFVVSLPEIIFLLLIAFGVLLLWRKDTEAPRARQILTLALALCMLSFGILRSEVASWSVGVSSLEVQVNQKVSVEGMVVREPDVRASNVHLYVESGEDILLVTADRYVDVSYGDQVTVFGTLKKPESFMSDLGREFNYPDYLLARGVEYQVSFASVQVDEEDTGNPVVTFLLQQKHQLMSSIERAIPEPQSGLGMGLLLGVKQALGDDLEDAFRSTGIIHIVVLSGYNVMLVVAFVLYVLSFIFSKRAKILIGITAIICFALLVGLSATVVRASIMATLLLIAQAFGRTYDVLRGLLLAGAVMIFINPYLLLYDIGFQLSFMATLGLLLVAPHFEVLAIKAPVTLGIRDFLVATIATQIAVLPLLLYYIGEVSLIAVVVNVLVLPVVPVAMLLTFVTGVVGFFSSSLATMIGLSAYLSLSYIIAIAVWFSKLPFASVTVPVIPVFGIFLLYGLLVAILYWRQHSVIVSNNQIEVDSWEVEVEENTKIGEPNNDSPTKNDIPIFFR